MLLSLVATALATIALAIEFANWRRISKAISLLEPRVDDAIERNLNTRRKKLHDNGRWLPARPRTDNAPASRVHKLRIRGGKRTQQ